MSLFELERPSLCEDAQQAVHAWRFCGGWNPERLPLYAALYGVSDWDLLIDLLMEIQSHG